MSHQGSYMGIGEYDVVLKILEEICFPFFLPIFSLCQNINFVVLPCTFLLALIGSTNTYIDSIMKPLVYFFVWGGVLALWGHS
jgi:hypothetical protein